MFEDSNATASWRFSPEGAALHVASETAVIADVHLGYEWSRGSKGDAVPAHCLDDTITKLQRLFARVEIKRLIVAGDLCESRRPCAQTARDVRLLTAWLGDRGVELIPLRGNHDPPSDPPWPARIELDGWSISHGHERLSRGRVICGHVHPVLKAAGVKVPCFVVSQRAILLPAFSTNAAGVSVTSARIPRRFCPRDARCLAAVGAELLDFGRLGDLAARLR